MTASPIKMNGVERSAVPVLGPWQPVGRDGTATVWEKRPTPETAAASDPTPAPAPAVDPVAEAEAAAIRARTEAETKAALLRAEAEADAIRIKAEADAERQRLANQRADMKLELDKATNATKLAEENKRREQAEREADEARKQAAVEQAAAKVEQGRREKSASSWKAAALSFAAACAVVALPVQMSAFYNPHALWLLAAPVMLEGGAWVVLRGAAAAVDDHRPHWHYRLIAWALAFVAAAINFSHGISHFDIATAVGTAFASLAGPGVWDLHEHGRIRVRDGVLTRKQRRAQEKAEAKAVAEKAAAQKAAAEAKAAEKKAADEAAAKLAADRAEKFSEVWEHALSLAAALGETTVTDAVWRRAYKDVKGTDPGDSAEAQQLRNAAERRLLAARSDAPDKAAWKITSAQVNPQVPPTRRRGSVTGPPVRGVRVPGDTEKFSAGARKQAAITAKQAARKPAN